MKKLLILAACLSLAACTTTGRADWRKIGTAAVAVAVTGLIVSQSGIGNHNEHEEQPCPNVPRTCH